MDFGLRVLIRNGQDFAFAFQFKNQCPLSHKYKVLSVHLLQQAIIR